MKKFGAAAIWRMVLTAVIVVSSLFLDVPKAPTTTSTVLAASSAPKSQYVVYLNGIRSTGDATPGDFLSVSMPVREALGGIEAPYPVYFSYGAAAAKQQANGRYCEGWGPNGCAEASGDNLRSLDLPPVYPDSNTRDFTIEEHAAALNWLLGQIARQDPAAQIYLVGFSLGGITASRWASLYGSPSGVAGLVRLIVLIESPVGGIYIAKPVLDGGWDLSFPWYAIIKGMFGDKVLRALQLPPNESGSIVGELSTATQKVPRITSIQSTADYLVNDEVLVICTFQQPIPCSSKTRTRIGKGTQNWALPQRDKHDGQVLGEGAKLATDPVQWNILGVGPLADLLLKNHNSPLADRKTVNWIVSDIKQSLPPANQIATLVFSTQPAGAQAGVPFSTQPVVTARDTRGNTLTSFTGPVTLTIKSGGTAGATLTGTTTVNAVAGVATFGGLSIDKSGLLYILTASAAGATSADSAPFNVLAPPSKRLLAWQTNAGSIPIGTVPTNKLVVVSPTTGGTTPLADWPSGFGIAGSSLTVDPTNRRITGIGVCLVLPPEMGGPNPPPCSSSETRLLTFDTQTGTLVSQPALSTLFGALAYDIGTGRLLAWQTNAGSIPIGTVPTNKLVVVSPTTGGTTPLADWPSGFGIAGSSLTVDPTNRRITGIGVCLVLPPEMGGPNPPPCSSSETRLLTFDTQTGTLVSQPALSTLFGALAYE